MKNFKITCQFEISASHFLVNYKGKCENLHGHNYKLFVTVEEPQKSDGMGLDFHELRETVKQEVLEPLDHKHLNDIIEQPTAENIAVFIWDKLKNKLNLHKIRLYESDLNCVEYEGK